MVCLDRSIHSQATSRRLARQHRRERELAALFGNDLVHRASVTDPAELDLSAELMDAVWDAADRLLRDAGNPPAQRAYVEGLSAAVRLVLCMWILDLDLAGKLYALAVNPTAA